MEQEQINKNYYILAPLTIFLGILVLVGYLSLAIGSFLRDIEQTIDGYGHMGSSVEASLIHDTVNANERLLSVIEESLDKGAITRGQSPVTPFWAAAAKLRRIDHFLMFYNARIDKLHTYPAWPDKQGFDARLRPWFNALTQGDDLQWLGPYPEFVSGDPVMTLVRRVKDSEGQLLGLLMVDTRFEPLRAAMMRTLNEHTAIYLTLRDSQTLVVGSNLSLMARRAIVPTPGFSWFGFDVLWRGSYLKRPLAYINWDLYIYLAPEIFRERFYGAMVRMVLPLIALFLLWFFNIGLLMRIFRQEQALVAGSLTTVKSNPAAATDAPGVKTWFVQHSLSEIEQVRASVLKDQSDLRLDPLTGVMNRRAFEEARQRLEAQQTPHWLVLFDVDNFKAINDSFGHGVGDHVLCRVASLMTHELGEHAVFRLGGDEFAVLITFDREELAHRLDLLLEKVATQRWREAVQRVTLSAGGAFYPACASDALYDEADKYLYQSKAQGRNCWLLS
ncbi:MAG: diguanylate cyclase domain-containing protein [Aeromonas sp.]